MLWKFEEAAVDGEGQGSLVCYSPWGLKESDTMEQLNNNNSMGDFIYKHEKNWLIGKAPDAGKDWRQEKKGTREDEMVEWHHRLNGDEFG